MATGEPTLRSGVYQIRCTVNGKVYVGSAADLRARWSIHRHYLERGRHHSQKLQRAWRKYGAASFAFEVLARCPVEELIRIEQEHIDRTDAADARRGYNVSPVAGSNRGVTKTPEQRAAMSAARRGRKPTEETRAKLREARARRVETEETRAKRSASLKGRVFTPEWRAKIGDARVGRKLTDEQRRHLLERTFGARRKFAPEQVAEIRGLIAAGIPDVEIMRRFPCCKATFYAIKFDRTASYRVDMQSNQTQ